MPFFLNFFQTLLSSRKFHLFAGGVLVLTAVTLLATGVVSESTVTLLRKWMNRPVSGEVTDYYLRKLNFIVYTLLFCALFPLAKSCFSLCFSKLNSKLNGWLNKEGFTDKSGTFLLFSFWMGIFFRAESYLCSHFWNDTLALICSVSSTPWERLLTHTLPEMQSAPPGVLILLKLPGEIFGYHEQLLTLPMFIAGILSLFIFYKLLRMLFLPQTRAVMFFLFAFNASAIFYAGELKQYGFDLFFCILLLYHTVRLLKDDSSKVTPGTVISGVAAVLFSHTSFLLLPTFGAVLFFQSLFKARHRLAGVIILDVFWALAVLGAALLALKTMPQGMYTYHAPFFAPLPVDGAGVRWYLGVFKNMFAFPCSLSLNHLLTGGAAAVCILAGIFSQWRRNGWLCICGVLPVLLMFVASFCKSYPIDSANNAAAARFQLFTIPLFYLFAGRTLEYLFRHRPALFAITGCYFGAAAVFILLLSFPIYWNIRPLCSALSAVSRSGEPLFINYGASLALRGCFYNKVYSNSRKLPESSLEKLDWDKVKTVLPRKGTFRIFICQVKYADQLEEKLKENYEVTKHERAGGTLFEVRSKN